MMSFSRVMAIFMRQLFLMKTNPTRLASIFMWLIIDILQWGLISKYLGTFGHATFSFITVILGAIILWEFMTRIQQGVMMGFMEDIWSQNLINFFASPLKLREYLSGLVAMSMVSGVIAYLIMIGIAWIAFGYNALMTGFVLLPFMVVLLVFGIAMGIFVAGIIFRLGPSAEWLAWPIPLVLSLFAGVFYPISTLPPALQMLAKLIPPSYIFESFRAILSHGTHPPHLMMNLVVSFLLSIVYLGMTSYFFIRIYRRNLQSGSIARFNAEAL
jgi:ABC-2 type transport system permease protein